MKNNQIQVNQNQKNFFVLQKNGKTENCEICELKIEKGKKFSIH